MPVPKRKVAAKQAKPTPVLTSRRYADQLLLVHVWLKSSTPRTGQCGSLGTLHGHLSVRDADGYTACVRAWGGTVVERKEYGNGV